MLARHMPLDIESVLRNKTNGQVASAPERIQSLWSGYGSILRYQLTGGAYSSVVVKHVLPPQAAQHPRGWNTDISHIRKLKSYQVETAWYRDFAAKCTDACRVPDCYAVESQGAEVLLLLEDLDAAGYNQRRSQLSPQELRQCVSWLAEFHATFLYASPDELWPQGSYWHLATRPDELKVLAHEDPALHAVAHAIDAKLQSARYKTLVHGDAKLANFCFSGVGDSVAAVDFQYVGGGCGMQDLAYFMGSCLTENECEQQQGEILNFYFERLQQALKAKAVEVDCAALESEWRALYPIAWTDFHRFLKGWSPGHWKLNSYSEKLAREVIAELNEEKTCS